MERNSQGLAIGTSIQDHIRDKRIAIGNCGGFLNHIAISLLASGAIRGASCTVVDPVVAPGINALLDVSSAQAPRKMFGRHPDIFFCSWLSGLPVVRVFGKAEHLIKKNF